MLLSLWSTSMCGGRTMKWTRCSSYLSSETYRYESTQEDRVLLTITSPTWTHSTAPKTAMWMLQVFIIFASPEGLISWCLLLAERERGRVSSFSCCCCERLGRTLLKVMLQPFITPRSGSVMSLLGWPAHGLGGWFLRLAFIRSCMV